jgi:hypothetical protein
MLCKACEKLFSTVKTSSPGSWSGVKPCLFEYPLLQDVWAGPHHIEPDGFLSAVKQTCYICSTLFRDCSAELREQARSFRTFYQLHLGGNSDEVQHTEDHYALEFTIEVLQGKAPIAEEQVFDCSGIFKILPRRGTFAVRHWRPTQKG